MTNQPKIQTRCPSCGFPSLFIDEAGHIVCSSVPCGEPIVEKAIEALKAEVKDANGALDDASVRRNDADSIACGIETLAKHRDDLADLWSEIGDIFWPEREKDDGYSDTAIREAVNELNAAIAAKYAEIAQLKAELAECDTLLGTCTGVSTSQRARQVMDKLNEALKAVEAKHDYACRMDALAEERNIEIARLKRQRDDAIVLLHAQYGGEGFRAGKHRTEYADEMLALDGYRIVGGQVEEVQK